MFNGISLLFSAVVPKKIMEGTVKPALLHTGSKDDARVWLGKRIFVAILAGIIGALIPYSILPLINIFANTGIYFDPAIELLIALAFALTGLIGTTIIFYLHLAYVIDGRKRMVENILPDFLYLVGNNLKSGMAPFYAFRSAVRPEFGPLSEEIKIATQKSLGIDSFSDALKAIGTRIDSKVLSDTTKFFAQALKSGGHLAQLIETTASDIKQTSRLKKELVTSTRMYTMFILFVVVIASPMLLAVSVEFLQILTGIQSKSVAFTGGNQAAVLDQAGVKGSAAITITPDFMKNLSFFIITINSLLASIFIGMMGGGKVRDGLKYAPLMIGVGIVLFFVFLAMVGGLLGTFAM